jgi:hypothetical protein
MKYLAAILLTGLLVWIVIDLSFSRKVDLRRFDPKEVAALDAAMWQSYYEKKPLLLFWQLARITRRQANASFWRSVLLAYYAAKAAFVFKDGKNRQDYQRALPPLRRYYEQLFALSNRPFDIERAAQTELEWWVVRRERDAHPPRKWTELQARVTATLYGLPPEKFEKYSQLRTQAMLYRDKQGDAMQEADWKIIKQMLTRSWTELNKALAN